MFGNFTLENVSTNRIANVKQIEQWLCLQKGWGEHDVFRCNVTESFGQAFHENISDTGCAY